MFSVLEVRRHLRKIAERLRVRAVNPIVTLTGTADTDHSAVRAALEAVAEEIDTFLDND